MFLKTKSKAILEAVLKRTAEKMQNKGYVPLTFEEKEEGFEVTLFSNDFGTYLGYTKNGVFKSFSQQIDWEQINEVETCTDCGRKISAAKYVFEKQGKLLVLGESCARKHNLGYLNEIAAFFREYEEKESTGYFQEIIPTNVLINIAYKVISEKGFKPANYQDSTKNEILRFHGEYPEKANEVIEFWRNISPKSDFEYTCKRLIEQESVSSKMVGYIAALVKVYLAKPVTRKEDLAREFVKKEEPFEAIITKICEKEYSVNSWVLAHTTEFTLTLENGLNVVFSSSAKKFQSLQINGKIKVTSYVIKNVYKNLVVIGKVKL